MRLSDRLKKLEAKVHVKWPTFSEFTQSGVASPSTKTFADMYFPHLKDASHAQAIR